MLNLNMYCIYLKQKINKKLECKKNKKVISLKDCTNCKYKEFKPQRSPIKPKSSKLANLERKRFSVFTENLDSCIICDKPKQQLHEIFFGSYRQKAMELGFVIPLCEKCHRKMHLNHTWQEVWHIKGQMYFEEHLGTRQDFIQKFGKSWIK